MSYLYSASLLLAGNARTQAEVLSHSNAALNATIVEERASAQTER